MMCTILHCIVCIVLECMHCIDGPRSYGTVSAGSSEVRKGGAAFLQLKLTVNNGGQPEDTYMG